MYRVISKHFTAEENRCKCGDCDKFSADIQLVKVLESLRSYFFAPVYIRSWFRCREHNNRPKDQKSSKGHYGAGSNDNSWHLTGAAVDFSVRGVAPAAVRAYLRTRYPEQFGVGIYNWGIHLDMREKRADWDERT